MEAHAGEAAAAATTATAAAAAPAQAAGKKARRSSKSDHDPELIKQLQKQQKQRKIPLRSLEWFQQAGKHVHTHVPNAGAVPPRRKTRSIGRSCAEGGHSGCSRGKGGA